MPLEEDLAQRILKILKFQPRGMTITELARKTGTTRDSVSRQLDILEVSGKVEMSSIGNARVYYTARRVPLSAFLCFTKNLILVLDKGCIAARGTHEELLRTSGLYAEIYQHQLLVNHAEPRAVSGGEP